MKIKMQIVESSGDTYQVETNLFTVVALERKFKVKASELAQGIAMEHLAFLAYESCKQHSITVPLSFDDYIKKLDRIVIVYEEPANPSVKAPTHDD
jgi:hypothetical protein